MVQGKGLQNLHPPVRIRLPPLLINIMIQFGCLCGHLFQNQSPSSSILCPTCNTSIQTPKESFSGLSALCPHCSALTPYAQNWLKQIRCLSCQKKFKATPLTLLSKALQDGEKKRLELLEQTLQTTLQTQESDLRLQIKNGEEQCQFLTTERDQYLQQWQYTFDEKTNLDHTLFETQQSLTQTQEFATHLQNELESSRNTVQDAQKEVAETQQKVDRCLHAFQDAQKELVLTEKRFSQMQQKSSQTQQELSQTQQDFLQMQQKLSQTQQELSNTQTNLNANLQVLEEERKRLEISESLLEKTQQDLKVSELARKEEQLKSQHLSSELSQFQEEQNQWQSKNTETSRDHTQLSQEYQQLQETYQKTLKSHQELSEKNLQLLQQETETLQQKSQLLQQLEHLSQTQQKFQNNEENLVHKFRSASNEWSHFVRNCEHFFSQRLNWLDPHCYPLPMESSECLREIESDSTSILKNALESYLPFERTLLKKYFQQIEKRLSSEIKFKYHRAIEQKKEHLQAIPKEIHFLHTKLERLNRAQGELIAQLKQTTQETMNALLQSSQQFFEQMTLKLERVPARKMVETSNLQLNYFCQTAQEQHHKMLTALVHWQYRMLYLRLPWIKPFHFGFNTPSFHPVFQSPMRPKLWGSLFVHLYSFFPILFSRLFPIHSKMALWQHQTLLLQQGKKRLQPLFLQQRTGVEDSLKEFLRSELQQLQHEFDIQLEKQKRKLHGLHSEQQLLELQEKQLTQRLDQLEIMQKGVGFLLQDLEDIPEIEGLDRLETSFHQLQQKLALLN